jgi:hypothetical protein
MIMMIMEHECETGVVCGGSRGGRGRKERKLRGE